MVYGIHYLDLAIIILYTIVMLLIGLRFARGMKNRNEFYLGGQRLGKVYQFFLNFGCGTNSDQAVTVAREVYRQGAGGMWTQFLVIFLTPFYWFYNKWYRRMRCTTMGDFLTERFSSKLLGQIYALQLIFVTILTVSLSYVITAKTMMALTPKPETEYSQAEKQNASEYSEYQAMTKARAEGTLDPAQEPRFETLKDRAKRGELHSYVSYVRPEPFYIFYGSVVLTYTLLGGLMAATVTDIFQGILIVVFSILLIPIGLGKVGGFEGLHARVAPDMFHVFSATTAGEYTWAMVLGLIITGLIGQAGAGNIIVAASARTEFDARLGAVTGSFMKRFIMLGWIFCGLLAIGCYGTSISDPDIIWGVMIRDFLPVGLSGLMLVGLLAANMSSKSMGALNCSALFVNQLYRAVLPSKSEEHYVFVSRIAIVSVFASGIIGALAVTSLIGLVKFMIAIMPIFGAPVLLGILWRRTTRAAVYIELAICAVIYVIVPNLVPMLDYTKAHPSLTVESRPAAEAGVKAAEPVSIYFDQVVLSDPKDPASHKMGTGRFRIETFLLHLCGADFNGFSKGGLEAVRFFFSAFFPILLVMLISLITRPEPEPVLNGFYAKMHTPAMGDKEEERRLIDACLNDPKEMDRRRQFPGTSIELSKLDKTDIVGFFVTWVGVGVVFLALYGMLNFK